MINTLKLFEDLKEALEPSAARKIAEVMGRLYEDLSNTVTKVEFESLKEVVSDLAKSQKELAEAQKRTEQRVEELAEAQKRTEQRVEELAEAQKRTEQRVEELAEAQKRTEQELRTLVSEHKKTRDILAGLSDLVGYGLEDRIFPYMKEFAMQEYGLEVEVLDRRNVTYPDGRFDEVNIYVEGRRDGEKVYLTGECKSRPGKKDIKRFAEMLNRLKKFFGADVKGFIVGFYYSPEAEDYLRKRYPEIRMVKSFEFELKYHPTLPRN